MPIVATYIQKGGRPTPLSLKLSQVPLIFEVDCFSDSETSVKFTQKDTVSGNEVILVWQFDYNHPINSQILDLLMVVTSLKDMGATSINCISPYLPYSRQETSGEGLEVGLIRNFTRLLRCSGVDKIISVELHSGVALKGSEVDITEIKTAQLWADHVRSVVDDLSNLVIVSPDSGGRGRAGELADLLGVGSAYIEKERFSKDRTRALILHGEVSDKTVVLVDDIIGTAGTAINACDVVLDSGARSVIGCFVHGIFSGDARKKMEKSNFEKVFVTDTILSSRSGGKIEVITINDLIVKNI